MKKNLIIRKNILTKKNISKCLTFVETPSKINAQLKNKTKY